ncbi:Disulfide bond chaperones of the HSP33 family [Rubellimicrobium thermophilum DSM 16684]|uniref:Disulfide bond chaperones of the HSP33 family n=1 Tax=Rubellimicrobium thermophilum DSM 16684 TaxID=1123069 RepID=S9SDY3_9RHOB|nr:Hsp33 family molecular chaperone HslO [Rubellimicrobium thermophilum]EPX84464.1 Disulfide bond chaperones of the HSP33 family [Rubellimicrobium thermophilum DSM 16684]
MSLGARLAWDDTVLPFTLDASDIRGRVARLDVALERMLAQHAYPPAIESLVAETALLAALIGPTIKLRWKLSIQVRGTGPARILAADYYAPSANGEPARLRAWASFDRDRLDSAGDGFPQIGQGYFALLIDQGEGTIPYQGITPLAGGSLAACAEGYFARSEQIPTRFALAWGRSQEPGRPDPAAGRIRAGGVMIQQMPQPGEAVAGAAEAAARRRSEDDRAEDWRRVNLLLDTVEPLELIGPHVQSPDLLVRLFHEEGPRVTDPQPVVFGCSCSEEKVRQSLSIYSRKDIARMTTPEGLVTADCQFCGAHYALDPATLGFEAEGAPAAWAPPAHRAAR